MNCKTAFAAIEARLRHLEAENRILQEELGIQECLVKQLCVKFATSPEQLKYEVKEESNNVKCIIICD